MNLPKNSDGSTLDRPKNYWALVVWLLMEYKTQGLTMIDAMRFDKFHKFQTRLLEIEQGREDKLKIRRLWITINGRFGKTMGHKQTFYNYKSLASMRYLVNLYNKLNRRGMRKDIMQSIV